MTNSEMIKTEMIIKKAILEISRLEGKEAERAKAIFERYIREASEKKEYGYTRLLEQISGLIGNNYAV